MADRKPKGACYNWCQLGVGHEGMCALRKRKPSPGAVPPPARQETLRRLREQALRHLQIIESGRLPQEVPDDDAVPPPKERPVPTTSDGNLLIHISVTQEEGAWVAHCLELDLVAVDDSRWHSVEKLALLINRQIEFGIRNKAEESIWFPAPKKFFATALSARIEELVAKRFTTIVGYECMILAVWTPDGKKQSATLEDVRAFGRELMEGK